MDSNEALNFARQLVDSPVFDVQPGMCYFLLTENNEIHGSGKIDSIHPECGPMSNGSPIEDNWIPDFRDQKTFDLCLGVIMRNKFLFHLLGVQNG